MKLWQLGLIIILSVVSLATIVINEERIINEQNTKISEITNFSTAITNDNNKLKAEIKSMKPLYYATQNLITDGRQCYISSCTGDIETYENKEGIVIGFNGEYDIIIQKDGNLVEIPRIEARQKRS